MCLGLWIDREYCCWCICNYYTFYYYEGEETYRKKKRIAEAEAAARAREDGIEVVPGETTAFQTKRA